LHRTLPLFAWSFVGEYSRKGLQFYERWASRHAHGSFGRFYIVLSFLVNVG
jgi:hypothetical protein